MCVVRSIYADLFGSCKIIFENLFNYCRLGCAFITTNVAKTGRHLPFPSVYSLPSYLCDLSFSRRTSSALGWPWVPLFFSKRHSRSRPYQATARSFTVIRRLSGIGTLVYSTRLYTPSYETRRRRPRRYSGKRCPGNHCCPYFISVTGATLALIPVPVQNGSGGQGRWNITAIWTSTNRRAHLNIYLTYETHTLG